MVRSRQSSSAVSSRRHILGVTLKTAWFMSHRIREAKAVEYATLKWVDWFNHRRLLEPIGNIPPAEAEEDFSDRVLSQALSARPSTTLADL